MTKTIRMRTRGASTMPWEQVHPFQGDLKSINPANFKKLKKSILDFGIVLPTSVWMDSEGIARCLDGHQRQKVFKSLEEDGYTIPELPVVFVEADTEREAKKILLLLASGDYGTIKEQGLYDYMKAADLNMDFLREHIVVPEVDLNALGGRFKTSTVKEHERSGRGGDDEVPEERKNPKTKVGDIWQLGRHRLMCGDSTSGLHLAELIQEQKIDMVYTDPPYGMKLNAQFKDMSSNDMTCKSKDYENVIGDHEDYDPRFLLDFFKKTKEIFLWGADYYAERIPNRNDGSWLTWDKTGGHETLDKIFASNFELCWMKARHKRMVARITWKGAAGMKQNEDVKRFHPTQKPVGLAEWFFNQWGESAKTIADIYGGSGSTLIACEKTDRTCFMMELSPTYVRVIIDRWEAYTGKKASLFQGGP